MIEKTKFEKDLEVYFPEIYRLHLLGKIDNRIWIIVQTLLEMNEKNSYGEIRITFQDGRINHVYKTENKV